MPRGVYERKKTTITPPARHERHAGRGEQIGNRYVGPARIFGGNYVVGWCAGCAGY